jgi:hypothetical protein
MITLIVTLSVLAFLFVAYCATGSIVRYRGGIRKCPQMIPHYHIWKAFADAVRDGWVFASSCGKRRAEPRVRPPLQRDPDEDENRAFRAVMDEDDIELDLDDDEANQPAISV